MSATDETPRRTNFITDVIDADLAAGRHQQVVTRFPPEPNGYLHIGHSKSIFLNHGLASDYEGRFHLRYDDTNPVTEDTEYVESIRHDLEWLIGSGPDAVYFASDYFDAFFECAMYLVEQKLAYVDSSTLEEIRERRGGFGVDGVDSSFRDRSVEENRDLLARMRAGEFEDGAHVLRARIDMTHSNMVMRDPLLYRIRHAHHHRTGDDWCIYPMYDFAHCLEDAFEGITHSICTLEFENNREIYDWLIEKCAPKIRELRGSFDGLPKRDTFDGLPHQFEFARLSLEYTVMSKRKLLRLVNDNHVSGWDDPRMPTVAAMRRRGVPASALRAFADLIGVAKTNSTVDMGKLEYCIRDELNLLSPRVMCVIDPIRVVITNFPKGDVEWRDAPLWPEDIDREETRKLPFSREIYIERADFAENPPPKWRRLEPGKEVRLRYGYFIECQEVVHDEDGQILEIRCTYDPETRGGSAPDGRKVKGTIHWVSADHGVPAKARLYDRLFTHPAPGTSEGVDFIDELNPESLVEMPHAIIEPNWRELDLEGRFQFERTGYFALDPKDSSVDAPVFNRIVTLRDSFTPKKASPAQTKPKKKPVPPPAEPVDVETERDIARKEDPRLMERYQAFVAERGLSEDDADLLAADHSMADFFEASLATYDSPESVAKWIVNELVRELKDSRLDELPMGPAELAGLARLVDEDAISHSAGKEVFARLVSAGGNPEEIVDELGLRQVSDSDALVAMIDEVLAANVGSVDRYRAGKTSLIGFFMGQVMKASRGKADPALTKKLLVERLPTPESE